MARLAGAHQIVARAARPARREPVGNITDPESGLQPLAVGHPFGAGPVQPDPGEHQLFDDGESFS
jgi:hypothetical protein